MSGWRLPAGGTEIDRERSLAFRFDGHLHAGFEGDTLASALLGSGVDLIARSFKFHRPRGIRAAGWEDPNAFVHLRHPMDEANVLATRLPLVHGLDARSQHNWPSLGFDLGAMANRVRALLPAGFYYKTFKWPQRAWPFYEHLIRRAAGLGRRPERPSVLTSERRHAKAAVLVVGAGLAGVAAALAVVRAGHSLIWVDDRRQVGGGLGDWAEDPVLRIDASAPGPSPHGDGEPAGEWLLRALAEIEASEAVTRLSDTVALGVYEQGEVLALERCSLQHECVWHLRVDRVVLATGAFESPLLFQNNDRPGVMLAGAAGHYLVRHAVACGRRVVLAGPGGLLSPLARRFQSAGVEVAALIVPESPSSPEERNALVGSTDCPVLWGTAPEAVRGGRRVEALRLRSLDGPQRAAIECDAVLVHGGWVPARQLLAHAPGTSARDGSSNWIRAVGAAAGHASASDCVADGWFNTRDALEQAWGAGGSVRPSGGSIRMPPCPTGWTHSDAFKQGAQARSTFVDLASDVTVADIALAQREGYEAPELLKRYTTLGMGPDQGRGAGPLGLMLMADLRGLATDTLPPTRARPPFVPIAFGTLAGADPGPVIRPFRETPLTGWHRDAGAVMYESGAHWRRPGYYPRTGESMADAIARECIAVRSAVGLYDSTPLGKFEIGGRDATAFLERLLPSRVHALAVGRGRYALLLREDGRLLDDGVLMRLGPDRYWLTSTAGHADTVHAWLEYARQWLFRDLADVRVTNVSAHWAAIVVCGPQARAVLARVGTDCSLDRAEFPFMAVKNAQVCGQPARIFRVSFTGELSFELNVRPRDALPIWQRLIEAGRDFGIEAVGSEANHVLRVEKGFISIGHEADGIANPDDLGLSWALHLDKGDFIGRRSIFRDRSDGAPRPQLVGLELDSGLPLEEGAQILPAGARLGDAHAEQAVRPQGFVTASVLSPTLGRPIALALLEGGRSRFGETVQVTAVRPGGPERGHAGLILRPARVVQPAFYDLEGERLRG
jgi:sarcosine oxidase subunit alpha